MTRPRGRRALSPAPAGDPGLSVQSVPRPACAERGNRFAKVQTANIIATRSYSVWNTV